MEHKDMKYIREGDIGLTSRSSAELLEDVYFSRDGPVENQDLEKLKKAALDASYLADRITETEVFLKTCNEAYRRLITQTIPDLMAELGELSEVKSSWGTVKLSPFWSGKITPETEAKAFEWLDQNGHGGIVKRDIHVSIMKGHEAHAAEVKRELDAIGADYEDKQGVNYQTLQGFIRAMAKAGTPVPQDLFNVYSGTVAKVSRYQ